MKILLLLLAAVAAFGQTQNVTLSGDSPNTAITVIYDNDSGNNLRYICRANSRQPTYTWAVTPTGQQGSLTSIAVATNVGTITFGSAHGLQAGNSVTVSGSTTAALNAAYLIVTTASSTTATIATSAVSDGTYNTAALKISTTAPLSWASVWSIVRFNYVGVSGQVCPTGTTGSTNAVCSQQYAGGSAAHSFACDSRATLAYQ